VLDADSLGHETGYTAFSPGCVCSQS
jgi:hypothetical protein